MCVGNRSDFNDVIPNVPDVDLDSLGLDKSICSCDYISLDDASHTYSTRGDMIIMQLNIHGLLSKQLDFSRLINSCIDNGQVDIVILCETWLNNSTEHLVNVPGYQYIGKVQSEHKGGGVGFLISKEVHFKTHPSLDISLDSIEGNFVEVLTKNRNILLGSIYRPPNTNVKLFNKEFENIMGTIKLETHNDVVIGLDHNLDFLKSEKHSETSHFISTVLENSLLPCITRPTRVTHSSATLIDNLLVSCNLAMSQHSAVIVHDISDHFPSITILEGVKLKKWEKSKIKS